MGLPLLKVKVGLVTGGAVDMGRATAIAMADAGARVLVCDVDVARGEPGAVAQAPLWRCSDRASDTTGGSLRADGGYLSR